MDDIDSLRARRADALAFVERACVTMRGPMTDLERALMHEDRKDARAEIAMLDVKIAVAEARRQAVSAS